MVLAPPLKHNRLIRCLFSFMAGFVCELWVSFTFQSCFLPITIVSYLLLLEERFIFIANLTGQIPSFHPVWVRILNLSADQSEQVLRFCLFSRWNLIPCPDIGILRASCRCRSRKAHLQKSFDVGALLVIFFFYVCLFVVA